MRCDFVDKRRRDREGGVLRDVVEVCLEFTRGVAVSHQIRALQTVAQNRSDFRCAPCLFERFAFVKERVTLLRVRRNRAIVKLDCLRETAQFLAFLGQPIEDESVVRLEVEQGEQAGQSWGVVGHCVGHYVSHRVGHRREVAVQP